MSTERAPTDIAWMPSPNHEDRLIGPCDMIILHYTGMDTADGACRWLCNPESKVSAHYLVDEAGHVTQMVTEGKRAWHAGVSCWGGETDINSRSIGIEIHNLGPDSPSPEFPEAQIAGVIRLLREILSRHEVPPANILAHSDVAPGRKIDPGPYFPWGHLAAEGIGLWADPPTPEGDAGLGPGDTGAAVAELQRSLSAFGYCLDETGAFDEATETVVRAFQLHFRPVLVDGRADASTLAALGAILKLATPNAIT